MFLERCWFPVLVSELLLPEEERPTAHMESIHGGCKTVLLPEDQNVELPLRFGSEHTVPPYRPVVAGYESSKPFECSVEAPSAHRSLLTQGVQDVSEPMHSFPLPGCFPSPIGRGQGEGLFSLSQGVRLG